MKARVFVPKEGAKGKKYPHGSTIILIPINDDGAVRLDFKDAMLQGMPTRVDYQKIADADKHWKEIRPSDVSNDEFCKILALAVAAEAAGKFLATIRTQIILRRAGF